MQPVTQELLERLIKEGHEVGSDVSHFELELCVKFLSKLDGFDKSKCETSCERRFRCYTTAWKWADPPPDFPSKWSPSKWSIGRGI